MNINNEITGNSISLSGNSYVGNSNVAAVQLLHNDLQTIKKHLKNALATLFLKT